MAKAIIFAAGVGSRIAEEIGSIPKSTLEINGVPIIRKTAEQLVASGVDVLVCTGFKPELIERSLEGLDVDYCFNPFFAVANNIVSLWMAKCEVATDEDLLLVSADVALGDGFIERLMEARGSICMAVDTAQVANGDYFFKLDKVGRILSFGSDLDCSSRDAAYIGLVKVAGGAVDSLLNRLDEMIDAGKIYDYFEEVCWSFVGDCELWPTAVDMAGIPWVEIDRIADYNRALDELSESNENR